MKNSWPSESSEYNECDHFHNANV